MLLRTQIARYFVLIILSSGIQADASHWYGLRPDSTTTFQLVTDFNLKSLAPDRSNGHQVVARRVNVHAISEKKGDAPAFITADRNLVNESRKLEKKAAQNWLNESTEYRWSVERPGKDVLYITAAKKIFLPDRNRIFSIYVRGSGHAHQVFALFQGPNKIQQEIFICSLDFIGWKRFEVVIPPYLRLRNARKSNRYELYFSGLKVQSYFRDQAGTSVFNLAEMFVVADSSDKNIPGAEMKGDF